MDKVIEFTACIAAGGDTLRPRIEEASAQYSEMSGEYFARLLSKSGRSFCESACGFLLADSLFSKHGADKKNMVLSRNADGRPCVLNRRDIDLSISHSEGGVMCAVCFGDDARVGCDIQYVRHYSAEKMAKLAEVFMCRRDLEEYLKTGDESLFYTIWTRREAYIKHTGGDVFSDLRDVEFDSEGYKTGVIMACGRKYYYSVYSEGKEKI